MSPSRAQLGVSVVLLSSHFLPFFQEVQHSRGGHHGQRCALHHSKLLLQGPAERPDDGSPQDSGAGGVGW